MSALQQLVERRVRLVERARHERLALAQALAPLAGADRLVSRAWPIAAMAAAVALLRRPRGLMRWVRYAIAARQLWRLVRG